MTEWVENLLWCRFDPWPRNICMPWMWQKTNKSVMEVAILLHCGERGMGGKDNVPRSLEKSLKPPALALTSRFLLNAR